MSISTLIVGSVPKLGASLQRDTSVLGTRKTLKRTQEVPCFQQNTCLRAVTFRSLSARVRTFQSLIASNMIEDAVRRILQKAGEELREAG